MSDTPLAFGPVPARRRGKNLGINKIRPKICAFACIYCQLGLTLRMDVGQQAFYEPEAIFLAVQEKEQPVVSSSFLQSFLTISSCYDVILDESAQPKQRNSHHRFE